MPTGHQQQAQETSEDTQRDRRQSGQSDTQAAQSPKSGNAPRRLDYSTHLTLRTP
jgi:hypothetical protein